MKLLKILSLSLIIFFLSSCSKSPLQTVKKFNKGFREREKKIKSFAKENNKGRRRTRDLELITSFLEKAHDLITYAEVNYEEYRENVAILKEKKIKHRENKFFSLKSNSFQYSHRNLNEILEKATKHLEVNKKYSFSLYLSTPQIFKKRPKGHKPGGSKKYESIRKKFGS